MTCIKQPANTTCCAIIVRHTGSYHLCLSPTRIGHPSLQEYAFMITSSDGYTDQEAAASSALWEDAIGS